MKKIILLLLPLFIFANTTDKSLLEYQQKYTFCHGHTNYQITQCLLNGSLNYGYLRGDKPKYKQVNKNVLRTAEAEGNVYTYVMSLLPKTRRYIGLMEYLDYLSSIKLQYQVPTFSGNDSEDIIKIKKIFNLLQDAKLVEDAAYTTSFQTNLLEYQKRHGLTVDGEIGPQTKRALKTPLSKIMTKVKKNLEIERMTLLKGDNYVLVNIPEFKMHYYENFEPVLSMKVVVGKTKMRTPVFSRKVKYIVLNPRWNVPDNIYRKEYAHKTEDELRKKGLRYNSEGKLYQPSGRRNALGVVKFLFPNKFNVYMHDTPSKYLFNRRVRAFSHGCIRLEKPLELLQTLGYEYNTRKNKWITVDNQVPVYVEYHTVWIDDDGIVQFRPDIYRYEKRLFR
jgi:murein L,D-transpeptidase YcbB/YkuD